VHVPSLSRLREQSGSDPYESNTIDAIHRLIDQGSLPESQVCAVTGKPTLDVLTLTINASTAFQQRGGWTAQLLLSLVCSWWLIFLPRVFARTVPVEESATTIQVPLRVSASHHARLRSASQRKLKRLLRTVPIYAKLLDENPHALVSVEAACASSRD
jgi:hypothetical protein